MKMEEREDFLRRNKINSIELFNERTNPRSRFHLFHKDIDHTMVLYTDGVIVHKNTWIDKYPYHFDSDWMPYAPVKRVEFTITDANFVLAKKKINHTTSRCLYVNQEYWEQFPQIKRLHGVNQISLTEDGHLKIKRLGELTWK